MPLLNIVVLLILAGVALYLINRYMASSIKSILNIVAVQVTGLWGVRSACPVTGLSDHIRSVGLRWSSLLNFLGFGAAFSAGAILSRVVIV